MAAGVSRWAVRYGLAACALALMAASGVAENPVESSVETRFQLDFHVPDAALASYLPAGFKPDVAAQGPAKDANLRLIFIDRVATHAPDGKPIGTNRLVYLAAPVKDPQGASAQLVIGGLTEDPTDAPGPFGLYLPAMIHTMTRSVTSGEGPILETQDWVFTAAGGERLELHIKFERGVGRKFPPADVKFYSAKNPGFYQISHQEQVLDVLRNVTTQPADRVKEVSVKASGGSYAKLFDGTEKMLSWDSIPWISRSVSLP